MARPAPVAVETAPADAEDAPKLVDAFSALLAEEEGDGAATVAGVVEMVGAPAPVPPPALEWAPGQTAAAPVEAAAETVAMQAVVAEATEAAATTVDESAAPAAVAAAEAVAPEAIGAEPNPFEIETAAAPGTIEELPVASPSPAALRADAPGQAALDGIDLDVFADAVAQKILHRLTDARIDAIVSERVLEIAERLVREEIDRIKADAQ
jgi:hypothetical protein